MRIVTGAVIVLVLLACDNGQPDTLADNGEVMLTLRISLPTATDGNTATRAITSNEENAIDIAQLKVLVFKASGSTETFSYEAPQVQLLGGKYMVTLKQSLAGEKYRLAVIANAGTTAGAREAVEAGFGLDAVSVCVDDALDALCELTGENASEAVIEQVFERFCVGK